MIKRTLKDIQDMVNGHGLATTFEPIMAQGVVIDSRSATVGHLYIPIIGSRVNGHAFVQQAIQAGAVATFWQQDEPDMPTDIPVIQVEDTKKALQQLSVAYKDALNLKVVGITGSNGKTSTKDILASILATAYRVHKTPGNLNSEFGMPLTLLMAPVDAQIAVLEMGMRGLGQIKLLSDMAKPDVSVITCIGEAHIEELGSRENISKAKFEITSGLSQNGLFVYHGDEPLLEKRLAEASPHFNLMTFGDQPHNDYYPTSINVSGTGMTFTLPQSHLTFNLSVLGKHNVMNALAAIAVAKHFDLTFEQIQTGLTQVELSKMRMDITHAKNGLMLIDDTYNSSPTSVRATLDLLYALTGYEKKIVVLGDMLELGEHAVRYHEAIGRTIDPNQIDILLTYGPLSQHTAIQSKVKITRHFDNKLDLAQALITLSSAQDVCLIKGSRGMALEDVIHALGSPDTA
ncbi:MAG: UDP-N-acetylmuramoyl-tripeptide--D-alanyl-D-alanine ligase [Defluviitaleaceae bacterium]|nr:UDP-N-acetylmuramoyl-tripeptide--D-alanyl-D-alanine ligase [Defluviitaleaceae bacterium]